MSAFVTRRSRPSRPPSRLPLTGERTVPGLAEENYWFRRHEVVYQRLADRCAGRDVLEAGCGEGYGADLIAGVARRVIGLDYDESAVAHVRARYPRVDMRHGNLAELPLPDGVGGRGGQLPGHRASVGSGTVRRASACGCCGRSGVLLMSTPNRITFSPGRDTPINPFHTRELNAAELTELLESTPASGSSRCTGVFHGPRLRRAGRQARRVDHRRPDRPRAGRRAVAGTTCWPTSPAVTHRRFRPDSTRPTRDIDDSLDLVAIAVRP